MPVARFMELALGHPELGYYQGREPFGPRGDFVSAPEISQMFGEIVAAWLAQAWADLGRPAPARLVELGPGRGTLMVDMLRILVGVPGLRQSVTVHMVETSARLRAVQRERLAGQDAHWHESLAEVPGGPVLLVANELFDALPVHQLVRTEDGWRERCVGLDPTGALAFVLADEPAPLAAKIPDAAMADPGAAGCAAPPAVTICFFHPLSRSIRIQDEWCGTTKRRPAMTGTTAPLKK